MMLSSSSPVTATTRSAAARRRSARARAARWRRRAARRARTPPRASGTDRARRSIHRRPRGPCEELPSSRLRPTLPPPMMRTYMARPPRCAERTAASKSAIARRVGHTVRRPAGRTVRRAPGSSTRATVARDAVLPLRDLRDHEVRVVAVGADDAGVGVLDAGQHAGRPRPGRAPRCARPGNAGSSRLNDSSSWSMTATVQPSPARREATAEPTRPHPTTTACTSNSLSPVYRRQERSAYHHAPWPASDAREPVGIGLLGYGTVGSSVDALLARAPRTSPRGRPPGLGRARARARRGAQRVPARPRPAS